MEVSVTGYKLAQKIKGFGINYTKEDADEDRWEGKNNNSYMKINSIVSIILAILMLISCILCILIQMCANRFTRSSAKT